MTISNGIGRQGESSPGTDQIRLKLSSPRDLAFALPHILGFRPVESLVIASAGGPRRRIGLTVRADLADVESRFDFVEETLDRFRLDGGTTILLGVFTEHEGERPNLPYLDLVERITAVAPVHEALLIRGGRCHSYLCDGPCCPADGWLLEDSSKESVRVEAAFASAGSALLSSREAVIAQIEPLTTPAATRVRTSIAEADRWLRQVGTRRAGEWSIRRLKELATIYEDPRAVIDVSDAARIIVAIGRIPVRDRVLILWATQISEARVGATRRARMAALDRSSSWRRLLLDLARLAPERHCAPPMTLFACAAYNDGDGVLVSAAVDKALSTAPNYHLAHLVGGALTASMHPRELLACWLAGAAEG